MRRLLSVVRSFFLPPAGTPVALRLLPYAVLGVLTLAVLVGSAYAWDYTNSPPFCGTTCHTMPPEYTAYLTSPHARIQCVECHIGRGFIATQITRKAGDIKHIVNTVFRNYEYPITTDDMRPARETCEKCHFPEKFSADKLVEIRHFGDDPDNTPVSIFLALKTGGGTKRLGLGRGIHWHIENRVLYYPADKRDQSIPFVRVYNDDGSVDEYVDVAGGFDRSQLDESKLKEMDCITCHNRITHLVNQPEVAVDTALTRGLIDSGIPEIHRKGVEVLRATYSTNAEALQGIGALDEFYRTSYPDYYAANRDKVQAAVSQLWSIWSSSVFLDQKSDWSAHPDNVGHKYFPGCFRCHDGKHLNAKQQAIRLECNLCHSIPLVAGPQDFVAKLEISRGPEPQSHLNANWLALHRTALDDSCKLCHTTGNPGGTDNTSFCSNSACHGTKWQYAGLDAPGLASALAAQLPTPTPAPTPAPVAGAPTYDANIQPIFEARCGMCHGDARAAGMKLTTYADALAGPAAGPVIIPGNAEGSKIVQVQRGKHFANLTAEELDLLIAWINAGAPEK